jgi:predicted Zn-dependent protease
MNMTRKRAEELLSLAMQGGRADEVFAVLRSAEGSVFRLADNLPSHPVFSVDASLQVTVRVGKQYMTVQTNDLSDEGVRLAVQRAVERAAYMPVSEQVYSFPGAADALAPVLAADPFSLTDGIDPDLLRETIDRVRSANMRAAGSIAAIETTLSVASSHGLFLHQPSTLFHAQVRVYTGDGWSTGFAEYYDMQLHREKLLSAVELAVQKCDAWKNPSPVKPSRMTTVFEPRALADMLQHLLPQFAQRAIKEDQSFLRRLDGSSFAGSKLFDERINLRSDPTSPLLPSMPFTAEGVPVHPATWVRNGVIEDVMRDRFEVRESGGTPVATPTNLIMDGGGSSVQDLIAGVSSGLLVSGFAQLSVVDPKNCLLTGSTRDGLYAIEDGKITKGVRNLLIRETPVYLFKEIEDLTAAEAVSTTGSYFPMLLPHIRVKDVLYGASTGMI